MPVGYGSGAVLGGRLADRLPPRRLCWAALALLAAGFAVAFFFPNAVTFILFYSCLGLGLGGGLAITGAVAAATPDFPGRAGMVGGALTAVYALSALFEVPLVSQLAASLGWVQALRLVGAGVGVLSALALVAMPALPRPARAADEHAPLAGLLRHGKLLLSGVIIFSSSPLGAYAFVNAGGFLAGHGASPAEATLALVLVGAGNGAGRAGAGFAADRLGGPVVLLLILIGDLLAALVFALAPSTPALLAAALLAGVALGGAAGVLNRLAEDGAPDAPHSAFGLLLAGYAAGAGVGPLLGAAAGGGAIGFLVTGAPALAGGVLWSFWRRR